MEQNYLHIGKRSQSELHLGLKEFLGKLDEIGKGLWPELA
jgi:hypothetical protein